jgi:hypothetical protein
MNPRTFPGPWRVEVTESRQFVIKDSSGFPLAYVYARSDSALHDKYLTPAEAQSVAQAITQLSTADLGDFPQISDQERKEANVRAALNSFGFELEGYMGTYTVTDQRAAVDLPSAIQPVLCQSLEEVTLIFSISRQ